MHFGLCSQQEHNDMKVEDLLIQEKDGGVEFVTFSEAWPRQEVADWEWSLR